MPYRPLTLAVFHRSPDVERHVAALRRSRARPAELDRKPGRRRDRSAQRQRDSVGARIGQDGVDRRRIVALIDRAPVASYGATNNRQLADLSRALGFQASSRGAAATRRSGARARACRAWSICPTGSRPARRSSAQLASRSDVIGDVLRSVNVSHRPAGGRVGARRSARRDWLPLAAWSVVAVEPDGSVHWLAGQEMDVDAQGAGARRLPTRSSRAASPYVDRARGRRSAASARQVEAAAIGWPLVANGVLVGVLVGFDHGRARRAAEAVVRLPATRWRSWSSRPALRWRTRCGSLGPKRCR